MPKPNEILPYDKHLRQRARALRNHATLAEVLLWREIKGRALGVEFHRQVPIGQYIVDFYCHEVKLAIEIDGSSHDADRDGVRQQRLEALGVRFLRFGDLDVKKQLVRVLEAIGEAVRRATAATSPSHRTGPPHPPSARAQPPHKGEF